MPRLWLLPLLLLALWLAMLGLGGPASPVDATLLAEFRRAELAPAARVLTLLGDWSLLLVLAGIGAGWLAWKKRPRAALVLILLVLSERLIVETLKEILDRARPDPAGHLVAVHSMAFPSGHAANAVVLGLGLALFLAPSRHRRAALGIALAYASVVGVTRLVLGVHWPSDVIGGWALGAAWTLLLLQLAGEPRGAGGIDPAKESVMTDRDRPDDSDIIDAMDEGPSHGGASGGNLQRDVATQAEEAREIGGRTGVTRVTGEDKPADGDEPTLPARD
jgi:undecaprenyl-diphosphatase